MNATRALEIALFAVGFAMSGLVVLALLWSGEAPYIDVARSKQITGAIFIDHTTGGQVEMDLTRLVQEHRLWSSYVTGGTADPPQPGRFYTADEISHMQDTRRVFDGAKILVPAGFFVMALRMQRARARGMDAMLRLVRAGALAAGFAVVAIGLLAVLAFDTAFIVFHQLFFPQGNFAFDPANSNLVRLYHLYYWQGITLRIGLTFIGIVTATVLVTSLGLRGPRSTRLATA